MMEVARDDGFRDGSGVHRVVQRLEARAKEDRQLARYLRRMEEDLNMSSAKSCPHSQREALVREPIGP